MTVPRLVAARTQRHGPLIAATVAADVTISPGEMVLLDLAPVPTLAEVALVPEQILYAADSAPVISLRGAGSASPAIAALLRHRDLEALATARRVVGALLSIESAAWSPDGARVNLRLSRKPTTISDDVRDRLAEAFRADVRLNWTQGVAAGRSTSPPSA